MSIEKRRSGEKMEKTIKTHKGFWTTFLTVGEKGAECG